MEEVQRQMLELVTKVERLHESKFVKLLDQNKLKIFEI